MAISREGHELLLKALGASAPTTTATENEPANAAGAISPPSAPLPPTQPSVQPAAPVGTLQQPTQSAPGWEGVDRWNPIIDQVALEYPSVPKQLVRAIIKKESNGNPSATGPQTQYGTAKGVGQFIDQTGRQFIPGWTGPQDSYDPEKNIRGIFAYAEHNLNRFGGDVAKAAGAHFGSGLDPVLNKTADQYSNELMELYGQAGGTYQSSSTGLRTSPESQDILRRALAGEKMDFPQVAPKARDDGIPMRLGKAWGRSVGGLTGGMGGALKLTHIPGLTNIGDAITGYSKEMADFYKVEDPKLVDKVAEGISSGIQFIVPSLAIAKGAAAMSIIGNSANAAKISEWLGIGTNAVMEAAVEAGGSYNALREKGVDDTEATLRSIGSFGANLAVLTATNMVGGMFAKDISKSKENIPELIKSIAKGAPKAMASEGVQEGIQTGIGQVTEKEKIDVGKMGEGAAIGALTAGLMSSVGKISENQLREPAAAISGTPDQKPNVTLSPSDAARSDEAIRGSMTGKTLSDIGMTDDQFLEMATADRQKAIEVFRQLSGVEAKRIEDLAASKKEGVGAPTVKENLPVEPKVNQPAPPAEVAQQPVDELAQLEQGAVAAASKQAPGIQPPPIKPPPKPVDTESFEKVKSGVVSGIESEQQKLKELNKELYPNREARRAAVESGMVVEPEETIVDKIKKEFGETRPTKAHVVEKFGVSREEAGKYIDAAYRKVEEPVRPPEEVEEIASVNTEPTDAQKEAGNYRKAHVNKYGFDISIENPAGSVRSGKDRDGKEWSQQINHDYGYIKGTKGADAFRTKDGTDQLDVFIKPGVAAEGPVYVVNQVNPKNGKFDEHKVMVGFDSKDAAEAAYLSNYEKGWKGLGSIYEMPMEKFKTWAYSEDTKYPFRPDLEEQVSSEDLPGSDIDTKRGKHFASLIPGVTFWKSSGGSTRGGKIETGPLLYFNDSKNDGSTITIKPTEGLKTLKRKILESRIKAKASKPQTKGVDNGLQGKTETTGEKAGKEVAPAVPPEPKAKTVTATQPEMVAPPASPQPDLVTKSASLPNKKEAENVKRDEGTDADQKKQRRLDRLASRKGSGGRLGGTPRKVAPVKRAAPDEAYKDEYWREHERHKLNVEFYNAMKYGWKSNSGESADGSKKGYIDDYNIISDQSIFGGSKSPVTSKNATKYLQDVADRIAESPEYKTYLDKIGLPVPESADDVAELIKSSMNAKQFENFHYGYEEGLRKEGDQKDKYEEVIRRFNEDPFSVSDKEWVELEDYFGASRDEIIANYGLEEEAYPKQEKTPRQLSPDEMKQQDLFGEERSVAELEQDEESKLTNKEIQIRIDKRKGGEADLSHLPMFEDQDFEGSQGTLKFEKAGQAIDIERTIPESVYKKAVAMNLEKVLAILPKGTKSKIKLSIVNEIDWNGSKVRFGIDADGSSRNAAMFWDRKNDTINVWLSKDLTSSEIAKSMMHELPGHYGSKLVYAANEDIYRKMRTIFQDDIASGNVKGLEKVYAKELESSKSRMAKEEILFDEWTASKVTDYLNGKKDGIVSKVFGYIRYALVKMGVLRENVDDVLREMVKLMKRGGKSGEGNSDMRFAKGSQMTEPAPENEPNNPKDMEARRKKEDSLNEQTIEPDQVLERQLLEPAPEVDNPQGVKPKKPDVKKFSVINFEKQISIAVAKKLADAGRKFKWSDVGGETTENRTDREIGVGVYQYIKEFAENPEYDGARPTGRELLKKLQSFFEDKAAVDAFLKFAGIDNIQKPTLRGGEQQVNDDGSFENLAEMVDDRAIGKEKKSEELSLVQELRKEREMREMAHRIRTLGDTKVKREFREYRDTIASDLFVPISTAMDKLHPKFKAKLRKFQTEIDLITNQNSEAVKPLLKKMKDLRKSDSKEYRIFDLSLKNATPTMAAEIMKKHGMESEYKAVRKVLDDIHRRAAAVGFDINYIPNYWPRKVINPQGLLAAVSKDSVLQGAVDKVIAGEEERLKRKLDDYEKAKLVDAMLQRPDLSFDAPGSVKERSIQLINEQLDSFYDDGMSSLVQYIHEMNESIGVKKILGKGGEGPEKLTNIDKGVGRLILDAKKEGWLKPEDQDQLIGLWKARFNYKPSGGTMQKIKELGYFATMGSGFSSFVSQITDQAWNFYVNGPIHGTVGLAKAIGDVNRLKREDIGVGRLIEEFRTTRGFGQWLNRVFKLTLLDKFDSIGKEAFINGLRSKWQQQAKKGDAELRERVKLMFEGETDQVLADLKNGKASDNVKMLLASRLLDFQPAALSEMPRKYLEMPNGRIFYMLKTFTIKQLDAFRNEGLHFIRKGIAEKDGAMVRKGMANLVSLASLFFVLGIGTDIIKDWIFFRKTPMDDRMFENLMKLFGISRFTLYDLKDNGGNALINTVAPPINLVVDPGRDLFGFFHSRIGDEFDERKDLQAKDFATWKSLPFVGKHYYWMLGGGKAKQERKQIKNRNEEFKDYAKKFYAPRLHSSDRDDYKKWYINLDDTRKGEFYAYAKRWYSQNKDNPAVIKRVTGK